MSLITTSILSNVAGLGFSSHPTKKNVPIKNENAIYVFMIVTCKMIIVVITLRRRMVKHLIHFEYDTKIPNFRNKQNISFK